MEILIFSVASFVAGILIGEHFGAYRGRWEIKQKQIKELEHRIIKFKTKRQQTQSNDKG